MDPIAPPTAMGPEEPHPEPEHSDKGPCRSACLRCCNYFFILIIFTIIVLLAIVVIKYEPTFPSINITEFATVKFEFGPESILQTKFVLCLEVDNSKSEFRFASERGSSIKMRYNTTDISAGTLPEFRQEPGTVTGFKVVMEGKNKYEGEPMVIIDRFKNRAPVPLVLQVEMPMALETQGMGSAHLKLNSVCALMVDHLDPQQQTNKIISLSCTVPNIDI